MFTVKAASPRSGYTLAKDRGVTDVWWPYGPVTGRYSIKVSGEQSGGRLLQLLADDGRGAAPPLHIHHDTDETWYVMDGRLKVFVGEEEIEAGPGDFVFGPMGVPHTFVVTSERAEFLVTFSPSGTRGPSGYGVDGFFQDVAERVIPGENPPAPREPDPEDFARRMAQYGIEMVGPPPTLDD
jgi:mannose-6-phosphate isomerase-like protein (cupin superfamily)